MKNLPRAGSLRTIGEWSGQKCFAEKVERTLKPISRKKKKTKQQPNAANFVGFRNKYFGYSFLGRQDDQDSSQKRNSTKKNLKKIKNRVRSSPRQADKKKKKTLKLAGSIYAVVCAYMLHICMHICIWGRTYAKTGRIYANTAAYRQILANRFHGYQIVSGPRRFKVF